MRAPRGLARASRTARRVAAAMHPEAPPRPGGRGPPPGPQRHARGRTAPRGPEVPRRTAGTSSGPRARCGPRRSGSVSVVVASVGRRHLGGPGAVGRDRVGRRARLGSRPARPWSSCSVVRGPHRVRSCSPRSVVALGPVRARSCWPRRCPPATATTEHRAGPSSRARLGGAVVVLAGPGPLGPRAGVGRPGRGTGWVGRRPAGGPGQVDHPGPHAPDVLGRGCRRHRAAGRLDGAGPAHPHGAGVPGVPVGLGLPHHLGVPVRPSALARRSGQLGVGRGESGQRVHDGRPVAVTVPRPGSVPPLGVPSAAHRTGRVGSVGSGMVGVLSLIFSCVRIRPSSARAPSLETGARVGAG